MEMLNRILAATAVVAAMGGTGVPAAFADEALIAEGERVFRQCAACHQIGPDAKHRVGPELTDVIGRTAGTAEGFRYSKGMVEAGEGGLVWTEEVLEHYLENPRADVKGTTMAFAGLKQEEDRQAVVAYIVSMQGEVGGS
jgi:cytochrome c2